MIRIIPISVIILYSIVSCSTSTFSVLPSEGTILEVDENRVELTIYPVDNGSKQDASNQESSTNNLEVEKTANIIIDSSVDSSSDIHTTFLTDSNKDSPIIKLLLFWIGNTSGTQFYNHLDNQLKVKLNNWYEKLRPVQLYVRLKKLLEKSDYESSIVISSILLDMCFSLKNFDDLNILLTSKLIEKLSFEGTIKLAEWFHYNKQNNVLAKNLLEPWLKDGILRNSDHFSLSQYIMLRKILFTQIPLVNFGLTDPAVSELYIDNDDIWIGTWNGGIARYNVSLGNHDTWFPGEYTEIETSVRSITGSPYYLYFLFPYRLTQFSKISGQWYNLTLPQNLVDQRPQKILYHDGSIYLITLTGLWTYSQRNWSQVLLPETNSIQDIGIENELLWIVSNETAVVYLQLKSLKVVVENRWNQEIPGIISYETYGDFEILRTHRNGLYRRNHFTKNAFQQEFSGLWITGYIRNGSIQLLSTMGEGLILKDQENIFRYNEMNQMIPDEITSLKSINNLIILGTMDQGLWLIPEELL